VSAKRPRDLVILFWLRSVDMDGDSCELGERSSVGRQGGQRLRVVADAGISQ
jgi:hypothetical protein